MRKYLIVVNFNVSNYNNGDFLFEKSVELDMTEQQRSELEYFINTEEGWARMWVSDSVELNQLLTQIYSTLKNYVNCHFDGEIQLFPKVEFYQVI